MAIDEEHKQLELLQWEDRSFLSNFYRDMSDMELTQSPRAISRFSAETLLCYLFSVFDALVGRRRSDESEVELHKDHILSNIDEKLKEFRKDYQARVGRLMITHNKAPI